MQNRSIPFLTFYIYSPILHAVSNFFLYHLCTFENLLQKPLGRKLKISQTWQKIVLDMLKFFTKKTYKMQPFLLKLSRNLYKTDVGVLQTKPLENKRLQSICISQSDFMNIEQIYFLVSRLFTATFPSSPKGSSIFPNCRFHLDRGNGLTMINRELSYTTRQFAQVLNFGDTSLTVPSGVNKS